MGIGGKPALTEDVKKDILRVRENYDFVTFMGREPTMRSDLLELITYAKGLEFSGISMATNGRALAYEAYAKSLINSGLTQLVMSFYGSTSEIYDSQAQVRGAYDQAIKAIKNVISLKSDKLSFLINIPVNRRNYMDLENTVKLLLELGVREMNILWVAPLSKKSNSKEIIGRMSELGNLAAAIAVKYKEKARFWLNEFLPCSLNREYRELFFNCLEKNSLKRRISLCETCSYAEQCDGVLSSYIDMYGAEEFKLD